MISILQGDLDGLESLHSLQIHDLMMCVHLEKNVFTSVSNLAELKAHGYLDVSGILPNLPAIEKLDMSLKMQLWVENFHQYYNPICRNSVWVEG